jgi:hypothetical protein
MVISREGRKIRPRFEKTVTQIRLELSLFVCFWGPKLHFWKEHLYPELNSNPKRYALNDNLADTKESKLSFCFTGLFPYPYAVWSETAFLLTREVHRHIAQIWDKNG